MKNASTVDRSLGPNLHPSRSTLLGHPHGMPVETRNMLSEDDTSKTASRSARLLPVILLTTALAAYTLQTELASYVQHTLDYKKPYFLFFCTHS